MDTDEPTLPSGGAGLHEPTPLSGTTRHDRQFADLSWWESHHYSLHDGFSKRDLMRTISGHVPPDVPLVVPRGIYAIAHGPGRSQSVAACLVTRAPRARAPPRRLVTEATGRWVRPSARPTTQAPHGSYRKRNLVETVHCTSSEACLGMPSSSWRYACAEHDP